MTIIAVLLLGFGGYMFFQTVKMKNTNTIPPFFINDRVKLERAKDKDGYINYMYPRLIVFSILVIAFAGISLASEYMVISPYITFFAYVGYIVMIIFYSVISIKAQNKYLF